MSTKQVSFCILRPGLTWPSSVKVSQTTAVYRVFFRD